MKRYLFISLFFLLCFVFVSQYLLQKNRDIQADKNTLLSQLQERFSEDSKEKDEYIAQLEKKLEQKNNQEKIYTLVVGGDLMLDRGVKATIKKLHKDYHFPFEKIAPYLHSADYVFANLEGSLSDVGSDQGGKYSFRFDVPVAQALADAGFDMVSSANNHMLDWGRASLCATGKNLAKAGVKSVGAGCNEDEANHIEFVNLGNTRIAFLAYTEFLRPWGTAKKDTPGVSEYNLGKIIQKAQKIKNEGQADLVFVSMHWGEEYKDRAPERIVKNAHKLINGGIDVIIGHHPHVDQEIERYGKGWIIYSLGNFVFDQSWSENTMQGLLAEIKVQNKKIVDIVPRFIQLNKYYQPVLID